MKKLILFFVILSSALSAKNYEILGIGTPCMDLLLHVEDEFLNHIGAEKGGSQHVDFDTFSRIVTLASQKPQFETGGSASNTLKGLASLGHKVSLFGILGNDDLGRQYMEKIAPLGIIPNMVYTETPSQQVMALITPDHQRTFRVFTGASNELKASHLSAELFQEVKLVHIEGYALYNGALVETAMKMAKEAGALVSFDLGSYNVVRTFKKEILQLIPQYVDFLFANELEVLELTGLEPKEGCLALKEICPTVIVLMGPQGCWVGSKTEIVYSPPVPVEVKDTTGAGDLFASGFLHGFLMGQPLDKCGYSGNLTGSTVVGEIGAEIPETKWNLVRMKMSM